MKSPIYNAYTNWILRFISINMVVVVIVDCSYVVAEEVERLTFFFSLEALMVQGWTGWLQPLAWWLRASEEELAS